MSSLSLLLNFLCRVLLSFASNSPKKNKQVKLAFFTHLYDEVAELSAENEADFLTGEHAHGVRLGAVPLLDPQQREALKADVIRELNRVVHQREVHRVDGVLE